MYVTFDMYMYNHSQNMIKNESKNMCFPRVLK